MHQRDIPILEWDGFLRSFSSQHRDWLVELECAPGAEKRSGHLQSIELEPGGQRVRIILAEAPAAESSKVDIEAPKRLSLEETSRGEHLGLSIQGDGDGLTLRFRVAALPEEVDGLSPGELNRMPE